MSGTSPSPSARAAVRETPREVVGRREEDADEVVVADAVAIEHLVSRAPESRASISSLVSSSQVVAPRNASNLTGGEITGGRGRSASAAA